MTNFSYSTYQNSQGDTMILRDNGDGTTSCIPIDPANSDYLTYIASVGEVQAQADMDAARTASAVQAQADADARATADALAAASLQATNDKLLKVGLTQVDIDNLMNAAKQ